MYQFLLYIDASLNAPVASKLLSSYPNIVATSVSNLNGVIKLLQGLKPYNASRPDKMPTHLIRECAKESAPLLLLLYHTSLKQSIVPTECKHGHPSLRKVTAHHIKVPLTSAESVEWIVYIETMNHLNLHDILPNAQHGL